MDPDRQMYLWRKMTPQQRQDALAERKRLQHPWHGPPHQEDETAIYLITAACYEHKPIIGVDPARMAEFERELLKNAQTSCQLIYAWVILPNHYHLLVRAPNLKAFLTRLGKFHGSVSYRWNGEDDCRGRQVWYRAVENGHKIGSAFLGHDELRLEQCRSTWICRTLAGLAVQQCRTVSR